MGQIAKMFRPTGAQRIAGAGAIAVALLLTAPTARAEEADPWWGRDKALHFGVSAGLAAGGYAGSSLALDRRWQRAAAGAGFALTLGAGKELYDLSGHGDASWRDFTWDVAGTAVGTAVALLVDVAIAGNDSGSSAPSTAVLRF